ncbi:MAG: S8 family serine peptidase, partial [Thermoflexales bacterium]|nr:S8 family serine peptidase [Thermoflexales bacterium]
MFRKTGLILRPLLMLSLLFAAGYRPGATTPSTVQAQPSSPTAASMRLSADLADALQVLPGDAQLRVIVRFDPTKHRQILSEQADKPLPERRAGRAMLVSRLQIAAEQSQSGVRAFLAQPAIAANVRHVRPLWAINALALSATPDVVRALAARDDVQMVTLDRWQKWIADDVEPVAGPLVMRHPPTRSPLSTTLTARVQAAPPAPGEVTWGLARIGADRVWRELGVTGAGVTVANIDTGVDLHHPALKPRYRGWNGGPVADHLHNWFDATNESATYPSDLHGHGTHTMGSIVGEGGIGVAPGARWMAAKGLNGEGFGYYSWLHAAFQFMLAPNGDPSFAPDILSNSWGSNDGSDAEFLPDIRALRAAGIFVLFANGNSGPGAGTVGSPASLPGAIGIGASDPDDDIARFSSRGPSPFNEVRPHLVAPGVNVVSTYPGGGYARASGTSMATPHVAGVAALLHSVSPTLDITATLFALTSTAVPLSTTLPNNVSGWGRVDAYRAVLSVLPHGVITGQVLHAGQPISGATVVAHDGTHTPSTTTDAQGRYAIPAPPGIYTVTASAFGFTPATSAPRIVQVGQVVTVNFALTPLPSGIVRGIVTDVVSGAALTRTLVRALDTPAQSYADSGLGYYVLHLPAGTYTIEARLTGYLVQTRTVVVTDGGITEAPFALTPTQRILLVDSGAWYYASAADFYRRALADLRLAHDEIRIKQIPRDAPTITDLLRYDTVIWSAPFDSPGIVGAGDAISRYLAAGRNLLLSGQDVAFYDGYFGMRAYFNRLNALFLDDSAPSRQVIGLPGTLLAGRAFSIAGGEGANNQVLPDVVGLRNADFGLPIARYDGESRSNAWAGVYAAPCLPYRSAFFSFGVEAIHSAAERAAVLGQTLAAFAAPRPAQGVALAWQPDRHREIPVALPGRVITHVVRVRNTGEAGVTETLTLTLSGNRWPAQLSQATLTLGPCRAATVVITVSVPTTATWHATDAVTLTASLLSAPAVSSSLALPAKTPAGVLLVDDDRFFDREGDYLAALAAHGNVADRWSTLGGNWTESPPLDVLQMYPLVIWFNAYDWFDPLRDAEATRLLAYLDGGGRLFLSSQSALYYLTPGHPFVRARLGIGAIDDTDVTSAVFGAPGHVIGSGFPSSTLLTGPGGRFPYNWNLSTALQPGPGVSVALRGESAQPFGLANAGLAHGAIPTLHLSSWLTTTMWRTAFMPFAFEVLDASARADLMNRVVGWLSWLGESELRAHVPDAAPGQPITFTLYAKLDEARSGAVTARVHLSATVSDAGFVAASDLAGASGHFAGAWQGAMSSGQVLSWTFVVTTPATLPPGTPLTATAFFALEEPGLRFARQAVIRLGAPQLAATLHLTPSPSRWGERITATAWLTNLGPAAAPSATLLAVVPSGLRLLTATVAASRPGLSHAPPNTVRWVGGLAAGESVSVTYAMTVPTFTYWPGAYYHAVLFGADSPLQRQIDAWI